MAVTMLMLGTLRELQPGRWTQYIPSKRRYLHPIPHGVMKNISQDSVSSSRDLNP